ncbi:efflux RND transporter permease subunit [Mariluticola halotolerans]|uniref:efflux RND transporter permease subunit n=1 Tax=Mariluticola halotolerans TaxID=2909283 RepID=UPI0026E38A5F|nr:efflux RND transporter permease subunit [Mariluticola halotolerans]UJQ94810.1 efflux RND transporter permease subunit [Mariluticola halotolerans]
MINFLERVLRMPRVVMTVMVLLLGAGFSAYLTLPKESFPAIDIPYFYVSVSQTGVSPRDAERLLAKPIEDRLTDLDGLESMTSTSTTGHVSVFLEFDVNADKDQALSDIRAKMDGVSSELPSDANEPTITEISFSDVPVLSIALYGEVPERTLVNRADELKEALEKIGDVQDVTISGSRDEVLEVRIDLDRLDAYDLTASQLFDALARNNLVVAGGTLDTGQGSFNVEVPGLITNAADVYSLPLKTSGDTVVTFGDVAAITRTFKDATEFAYVNGSPAITIGVTKKLGTNIIQVSEEVRRVATEVTDAWPAGIQHSFLLDQSESTIGLYRSLEAAVLTAVALVLITCIATLGVRPALMIGTSIPISFMIAFLVVQTMGMSVNMMVMFGLVIAVGVLVDDPIVVVEYAERKLAEGLSRKEAFIYAARKMFVPVVSATATTLGAFIPLLFWPGIIGKFMSYLPITVIVVMVASLLSALVFMPIIGAMIARSSMDEKEQESASLVMYPDKFDAKKVPGLTGVYVRVMSKLLHHPILTLTAGFSIVVGIFVLYSMNPTGTVAFPASEPEYGTVSVVARGNYSPVEIRGFLREVEAEVLQVNGIQDSILTFGGGDGGFGANAAPPDTIGTLQLQLLPWKERVPAAEIFENIRERVKDIPGLDVQIAAQEDGPPAGKAINLRVESNTYDDLEPSVAKLRDYIENDLGGTIDIEDGRPAPGIDWQITVDRVQAAKYGIGVRELSPYIQLVTTGVKVGSYRPDDATDELDIRVRLPEEERSFAALDTMRIVTSQGLVPVSNFISRKAVQKVANITRRDSTYVMSVAANLEPGLAAAEKVAQLQAWAGDQAWPTGVEIVYGGAEEQTNETNAFMVKALVGALFLIFLVLLIEYNRFWQVFVTLTTVVMSMAGVLLGMLVTGMAFSAIMTGLGIVALAGIVVKNGIVLIDTYNHYNRDDGVEPIKAMLLTTAQRVRPVLLTATVTALGVIPMALNVEFDFVRREIVTGGIAGSWFINLSAALVSGLFLSTLLTLVMVPVMITAPSVIWARLSNVFAALSSFVTGLFGRRPAKGSGAEIPGDLDSARKYMEVDQTGLVETETNGVTVVSRQAAE